MQRSVVNWDEVQRALTPSPSPTLLTMGRATAAPTRGFTPRHLPSDGSVVICCKPSTENNTETRQKHKATSA